MTTEQFKQLDVYAKYGYVKILTPFLYLISDPQKFYEDESLAQSQVALLRHAYGDHFCYLFVTRGEEKGKFRYLVEYFIRKQEVGTIVETFSLDEAYETFIKYVDTRIEKNYQKITEYLDGKIENRSKKEIKK